MNGIKAAIARLRVYVPPPTQYYSLPLARRAAVLILLYADKHGELRVVLTMRAKTLKSCTSHAPFVCSSIVRADRDNIQMPVKRLSLAVNPNHSPKPRFKPPAVKPSRKSACP
jgi:hypothetical protein